MVKKSNAQKITRFSQRVGGKKPESWMGVRGFLARKICPVCGQEFHPRILTMDNGKERVIESEKQWEIVKTLAEDLGLSHDEIVTVGDGSNDIEMLRKAGLGIGFDSKEITSVAADGKLQKQDLKTI